MQIPCQFSKSETWVLSKGIQIKIKLARSKNIFSGGIQTAYMGPSPRPEEKKQRQNTSSLFCQIAIKCFKQSMFRQWNRDHTLSITGLDGGYFPVPF